MTTDSSSPTRSAEAPESLFVWWGSQRWRYNRGLVVAGIMAFVAYCIVAHVFSAIIPEAEVTVFTIAFQAFGYLLFMLAANVCYFIGPISERFLHPNNPVAYRRLTFALGFCLSVMLPFFVPALLTYYALFHRLLIRV